MKKLFVGFLRRGVVSCGIGPIILAVVYFIMQKQVGIDSLSINQVCVGILSVTSLAFIAGGMNVIYQIERIPLMLAILVHGVALYVSYLLTYLLNDWLALGLIPVLVFTAIFIVGYLAIWAVVYCIVKRNTKNLNARLKEKQNNS